MTPRKNAPSEQKLALKLSAAQRKALLQGVCLTTRLANLITATPASEPVQLCRADWEDLGDCIAEEASCTRDAKLEKHFDQLLERIADLFERQDSLGENPHLRLFDPDRDSAECDLPDEAVYQLHVSLQHAKPPVWRRVATKDCTLARLHEAIQLTMGWEFSHLFAFEVGGDRYTKAFDDPCEMDGQPANQKRLRQLCQEGVKQFAYVYDFGDGWQHTIKLEKVLSPDARMKYPRCIAGSGACPPEDCGGVWGYQRLLEILKDPEDPEYDEMRQWVGGRFDPTRFSVAQANRRLACLRR